MSKSKTRRNLQNFQIKNKYKTISKSKKRKREKGFTSAKTPRPSGLQIICRQGHTWTGRQRRPKKCPICGTKRFRNMNKNTYDPTLLIGLAIFLPPFNSPFDF